jgi:hypothetical protein
MAEEKIEKLDHYKLNPQTGRSEQAYEVTRTYALQDKDGEWRGITEKEEITQSEKNGRDEINKQIALLKKR